jgi:hypothetical protein
VCVCVFCSASSVVSVSVFFWFFGLVFRLLLSLWRTLLLHCDHVCFAERHLCCVLRVYVKVVCSVDGCVCRDLCGSGDKALESIELNVGACLLVACYRICVFPFCR